MVLVERHVRFQEELRAAPTRAESRFRELLDELQVRYVFQQGFYTPFHRIVDFYLPLQGIAFEIDGCAHDETQAKDATRDAWFERARRIKIYRFSNDEVFAPKFASRLKSLI